MSESSGIVLGTTKYSADMKPFVISKPDLSVVKFKTDIQFSRIINMGKLLSKKKVLIVGCHKLFSTGLKKFYEVTSIPCVTKYISGTFTNPSLPNHLDVDAVLICNPKYYIPPPNVLTKERHYDARALQEASGVGIQVCAFVDSNYSLEFVDFAIPMNLRSSKSVALMLFLLARVYLLEKDKTLQNINFTIEDFEYAEDKNSELP